MSKRLHSGGQAVIEGVMMRGRNSAAVAVRRRDGEIVVRNEPVAKWATGRIRDIPLLRGPIVLLETVILGMRSLSYSASVAIDEEDQKLHPAILWSTMAFGFILAVGLFVALPLLIVHFLDPYITATVSNVADGVIRLVVFIVYLNLVSLMPDIRRVFAYHGAEHATINAYEAGEELEVDSVRGYGTAHTRCGTGFILMVLVIAVIAHAFLGRPPMWLRFLERLAILPVIGAFSYEMMKFSADHIKNRLVHLAIIPGLVLQRMTTRKPDDSQLEVAITALKSVLAADAEPSE
ncbi:MAG: DUF1385 domain-containing protein [Dehalococcoidia bacterium]